MNKTNLTILIFFSLHTFFVTCIDCLHLWPTWLVESPYTPFFTLGSKLQAFYVETYQDKFAVEPPLWFVVCTWMELVYHLPTCLWVVRGVIKDDPLLPLGIIPWAVQTFVTTLLCVVEIWSWDDRSDQIKWGLTQCYGPYLVVSAWLLVVMSARVKNALLAQTQQGKVKAQ